MIGKFLRFYVYSNLHISVAAGIFILSAYLLNSTNFNYDYGIFIIASTFLVYNLHRFIGLKKIPKALRKQRHSVFQRHSALIISLCAISVSASIFTFLRLPKTYLFPLLVSIIISAIYILPVFNNRRARDYPYIKIILISITWSLLYIIPLDPSLDAKSIVLWVEKFFFIFSITIPFDNRDREIDIDSGLKTIANMTSSKTAVKWANCLILVSWVLMMIAYQLQIYTPTQAAGLTVVYFITYLFISNSLNKSEFFFLAYLDGTILLNGLAIVLGGLI